MKTYVVGLAFNRDRDRVVMIEKQRPEWQKGKLNGVGGHIEPDDDTPAEAMCREFHEETDCYVPAGDWTQFLTLISGAGDELGTGSVVYFFTAELTPDELEIVDQGQPTDEAVVIAPVVAILSAKDGTVAPNMPWVLPCAVHQVPLGVVIEPEHIWSRR